MTEGDENDEASARADTFRICLDLNIWCADAISRRKGRRGTVAQDLAAVVRDGKCALGPTQLVVSWGMLTRLKEVLVRKLGWRRAAAEQLQDYIVSIARLGPERSLPYVLLGGTGHTPLRDAEDMHVLEVAVAGRAHVLATYNFADFVNYRTKVLKPGRIAIHRTAEHEVIIAHPEEVVAWTRSGEIVLP